MRRNTACKASSHMWLQMTLNAWRRRDCDIEDETGDVMSMQKCHWHWQPKSCSLNKQTLWPHSPHSTGSETNRSSLIQKSMNPELSWQPKSFRQLRIISGLKNFQWFSFLSFPPSPKRKRNKGMYDNISKDTWWGCYMVNLFVDVCRFRVILWE